MKLIRFPNFRQRNSKDCGPTCLKIVAKYYKRTISLNQLTVLCETTREGSNLYKLGDASEKIGFRSLCVKLNLEKLRTIPLPCILHWDKNHYVVIYKIVNNIFFISDPAQGLVRFNENEMLRYWIGSNTSAQTNEGIALLLEPTVKFYETYFEKDKNNLGFNFLSKYFLKYKSFIWQLVIGLLISSLLQLILPFLTQSVVDVGINNQDIDFIYLVLFAQLALFVGRTSIEVIRSWILLHLSSRIIISLVSDFFMKLMSLPISFFDIRVTGDIFQRINDIDRIESIMTTSSLNVLFSTVNLIVFSCVLVYYNITLFTVFCFGSILYFIWILIFLKKRKKLDYKHFSEISEEHNKVVELINGMQEIKLHNAEKHKRWSWEFLQAKLFKTSIERLALEQYQSVGTSFINELKNIFITILSAKLVVDGEITLGMMLAISYIVGQLNSPVAQLVNFIRELQDARISLERLSEIFNKDDEESESLQQVSAVSSNLDLRLSNISFHYAGSDLTILKNLELIIPANKVTAIVGESGSGKTTLMKLLLKFYEPSDGCIQLGKIGLTQISHKSWRHRCGVVMQEGFIFNDTIANNIAVGENYVDKKKLALAVDIANIREFIENLPLSYNTIIGAEGLGISAGQKQRLLIARAVYRNPDYLFFDEATSALDTNNEKIIIENLNTFFKNKTVVVIAHRLSTVKNAFQVVVLDKGGIVEVGKHDELVRKKGHYYKLVKNQLELGN